MRNCENMFTKSLYFFGLFQKIAIILEREELRGEGAKILEWSTLGHEALISSGPKRSAARAT